MFKLNRFKLDIEYPPQIIAEIGVNHDGKVKKALKMVDKANELGIKFVKFQNFKSENIVSKNLSKAPYQSKNTFNQDTQFSMLKKLELSENEFIIIKKYCDSKKMIFLSTPYDYSDLEFLIKINTKLIKISSSHSIEFDFVKCALDTNKSVILSTGMFNETEINKLSSVLKKHPNKKTCIMQCTSNYPADFIESNLNILSEYKRIFNSTLGFSDHTKNNISSIMSVAMGVRLIEKHFTLNTFDQGPDHSSSLDPNQMKEFISDINNAFLCLGSKVKKPSKEEKINLNYMRRSIFSSRFIPKGKKLTKQDICFKRPGNGISPNDLKLILGKEVKSNLNADLLLSLRNFK